MDTNLTDVTVIKGEVPVSAAILSSAGINTLAAEVASVVPSLSLCVQRALVHACGCQQKQQFLHTDNSFVSK